MSTGSSQFDPSAIRGVLFDLDNTLYDRDLAFRNCLTHILDTEMPNGTPEAKADILDHICALDASGYGSKAELFHALGKYVPRLQSASDAQYDAYYDSLIAFIQPDPALAALLPALESAGLHYGIVTNGGHRQRDKIESLALTPSPSCIFVSNEFGAEKPDPSIFAAAAKALSLTAGQILFVGDHPIVDIVGAKQAGMWTAWLHRANQWPADYPRQTDLSLGSLAELAPALGLSAVG